MNGIKIRGTGRSAPGKLVTNRDLETIVDTSDAWITSRTGIKTRHHCGEGETISAVTAQAARRALEDAGVSPEEIGACIVATVTPDTLVPSAACMLQRELGLPQDVPCFDLNAACTGFLFALHTMECLLNASPRKYGLVVGAENLSRVINWEDRGTCILFGDGAGAAVVECREGWPSVSAVLGCRGNDELLRLPGPEAGEPSYIAMEGTRVFKFAVEAVPWCVDQVLKRTGRTAEDVDFFVFHQANARIIDLAVRKYRIPPEKYYKNIAEYGNTSAASIPLVLSELREQGRIGPGSRILAVGFGGGLTWGGCLIEFA
ncbi:beta-ketoacyl-ACP synthase III [Oscillibacter sp.]|uniref:beta-ketoacyl-ACP synthase III n=1 Tax=Oscillibacter sp. TaxID=1945593 RepID=UPI002D80D95E|nr:beta-ketoacyl-ACP synthase III [Oscillibacter sp.]